MEHRKLEDELYTPAEQQKILKLAAELQCSDPNLASHLELENAAKEIGIEPRFVQLAAQQVRQSKRATRKGADVGPTLLAAAFFISQWIVLFGLMSGRPVLGGHGQHLWLAIGLAFVLGAALSGSDRKGLSLLTWMGSTLLLGPVAYLFVNLVGSVSEGSWPIWVMRFLAIQGGTLVLGHGLGRAFGKWMQPRRGSAIETNGSSLG